jgi:hypothetical protein
VIKNSGKRTINPKSADKKSNRRLIIAHYGNVEQPQSQPQSHLQHPDRSSLDKWVEKRYADTLDRQWENHLACSHICPGNMDADEQV